MEINGVSRRVGLARARRHGNVRRRAFVGQGSRPYQRSALSRLAGTGRQWIRGKGSLFFICFVRPPGRVRMRKGIRPGKIQEWPAAILPTCLGACLAALPFGSARSLEGHCPVCFVYFFSLFIVCFSVGLFAWVVSSASAVVCVPAGAVR